MTPLLNLDSDPQLILGPSDVTFGLQKGGKSRLEQEGFHYTLRPPRPYPVDLSSSYTSVRPPLETDYVETWSGLRG